MKKLIIILFITFLLWMIIGTYLIQTLHPQAHLVMGLGVCFMAFILMPTFIYYRYKDGKYKKYQIKDENLFNFKQDKKN